MKKKHIIILLLLGALLMSSVFLFGDISTYASIQEVCNNPGKEYSVIAKLDTTIPITYDPIKDPNYLRFSVQDSTGSAMEIIYRNTKPTDMERAERLVLKGYVGEKNVFECKEILMKCPSKYNNGSMEEVLPSS